MAMRRVQLGVVLFAMLVVAFLAQPAMAQHTSTECPPQTATVASGGTVTIDITDCAYNIGFAGFGPVDGGAYGPPVFPLHGTGNMRRQDNGPGATDDTWMLDYSHNGTTGIGGTDVFEIADASFNGDGDVQITITITSSTSALTTTPLTLPVPTVGVAFSQTLSSTGGTGPYSYAVQAGALPSGLTLSPAGVISGTPTQRGSFNVTIRATDSLGATGDKSYAGTLIQPTLVMSPNLITIPRNQFVSRTLSTTGGVAPYSYMVETFPSTMPAGLSLSSAGVISGTTLAAAGDIVMVIRVTDSSTGPGQWFEGEPLTIRLTDNQTPTANAGTDQTVASAASVTLDGTASSDPESQPLTYAWTQTGGPAVVLSGASTAQPTFTAPTVAWNAPSQPVLTFSLTVSDGVSTSTADTVQVTVNRTPNLAPTANAGADQTVASAATVTLNATGSSDPEGQTMSASWTQTGGPAVTLSSAMSVMPTFTAPTVAWNAPAQVLTFSLTVSDGVNTSIADTVQITVNPAANQRPVANAGADQSVASAAGVTLNGTGSSDPEGEPLAYSWTQTGGPAVTLSGATAASPTFTAPSVAFGDPAAVLTFSLVVDDGTQNSLVADTVQITVNPQNFVPTANAGADQTVASAASGVTLDGTGSSDPEGQPLAYNWTQTGGPAVALSGATAASPSFTAPTVAWNAPAAVLTFSLTVDDGVNTSTADTVQITVNPAPNQLPTANAGADQTVASAAGVTLDGTGSSDPENQPLAYNWTQTGGLAVTLSNAAAASPSFTAPTVAWNAPAEVLTFSLTVDDGVNTSTADTVQVTVNPAPNQVPTANAGPDQTVASAAGVTLDGTGSGDPEGLALSYAWTQTGGPAVTLSSTTVASPSFTAPTLGWNVPDAQLTFQLIVNDALQDSVADTVTITVTAPVDTSRPTVTLSGMPASVMPGDAVSVTVTFSEVVSGLAAGDFTVANGTVTGLAGSGANYTLSLTAGGGGVLSVMLPADSAVDVAANGNLASNTLTAAAGVIEETETAIAEYLSRRANALAGAQPGLIRLLNPGGPAQISVSSKGFTFATNGTQSVWASLQGQWGESGDTDTRYVLGAVGTHAWLNDRTILGVMLEFDQMVQDDPTRRIEGTGWLIGPYVAGQIQDQPLYYEGRLLWGQSDNEIAQTGQPAASFGSERFLAQLKLQGEFALGQAIVSPFVDASYVSDKQEAYTDGLGNPISAQEVRQSQIALGIDLRRAFAVNGGVLTPSAGISAIYSDTSGAGTVALTEPEHDGWRGRLRAGVTYSRGLSRFEAATFLDGLGTGDYRDYGLSLGFETQF